MASNDRETCASTLPAGGYDEGYESCPMFWPDKPGSVLLELDAAGLLDGGRAIDLGCGEGTNAAWLDEKGYEVSAVDVSRLALRNARAKYPGKDINWQLLDASEVESPTDPFDVSVAYGLVHCLPAERGRALIRRMREWTAPGGYVVLVCFNDRSQDLSAHPGFNPTLLPHDVYVQAFADWELVHCSDSNLYETHPHNNIPHHHSMTRIAARRTP